MILLETNVISELMKASPDLGVLNWLDNNTRDSLLSVQSAKLKSLLVLLCCPLVNVKMP